MFSSYVSAEDLKSGFHAREARVLIDGAIASAQTAYFNVEFSSFFLVIWRYACNLHMDLLWFQVSSVENVMSFLNLTLHFLYGF